MQIQSGGDRASTRDVLGKLAFQKEGKTPMVCRYTYLVPAAVEHVRHLLACQHQITKLKCHTLNSVFHISIETQCKNYIRRYSCHENDQIQLCVFVCLSNPMIQRAEHCNTSNDGFFIYLNFQI